MGISKTIIRTSVHSHDILIIPGKNDESSQTMLENAAAIMYHQYTMHSALAVEVWYSVFKRKPVNDIRCKSVICFNSFFILVLLFPNRNIW